MDVVQRFLRRVPKSVRLPVVRPTVSEKGMEGQLGAGGILVCGLICFLGQRSPSRLRPEGVLPVPGSFPFSLPSDTRNYEVYLGRGSER